MAKNREAQQKVAESESESGEEKRDGASSEEDGSSEYESDSEPEQTQKPPSLPTAALKKSQPQSSAKPQQPSSSSDEEESGSESESESEGPESNVRPIASKPMDDSQKPSGGARKLGLKPSASEPATPAKSTGSKRLAEEKESEAKSAKRSKGTPEPEPEAELENSEKKSNDDSKKQLFQRLWSEDDEIVMLKGMIDYAEKKKSDPVADLNDFHDFIKDSLHVDVTRAQLQDKIRRLKKKYENNKSKEKEGKDRTFSKPHEQKAYELSKQVWRNESGKENGGERIVGSPKANGSVRKTQSKRVNTVEDGESEDVKSTVVANSDLSRVSPATIVSSTDVSMDERVLRIGAEMFEGDKPVEGEREWRKLRLEEMEVYLKKLDLMRAQTKLVLDVLKSKNH